VRYVLNNWRHHGARSPIAFDDYSTGRWFAGWRDAAWEPETFDDPAVKWALWIWRPTSWLLRKVGDLSAFDVPGAR